MAATYEVGQVRTGRVTRVADFGAFVELEPGIEGLAHASTFAPTGRTGGWAKSVPVGIDRGVRDPEHRHRAEAHRRRARRRRHRRVRREPRRRRARSRQATIVTGKVERHEKFGVFVFLSPGRTGLMPFAETGLDRDADMLKAFPIGSEVEVAVLEVDPAGRRIRLSRKAVAEQREQAELREYAARPDARRPPRWDRWPTTCVTRSRGVKAAQDPARSGRALHGLECRLPT